MQLRRFVIAVAIIAGSTIPALIATVWLFGCCVLPFHRVMHRLVPLCRVAIAHHDSAQQPSPTPQDKQRPAQQFKTELTAAFGVAVVHEASSLIADSPAAYRSFITLGALRCDQDIGLNTLFGTFII